MGNRIVKTIRNEPVIRVSMAGGKPHWDFILPGSFSLMDGRGQPILQNHSSDLRWRIQLESYEPAQYAYCLMLGDVLRPGDAERLAREIRCSDFEPNIQRVGGSIVLDGIEISRREQYRVLLGEFNSTEDAFAYGWKYLDAFDGEIVREKIREPRGTMEVFDAQYGTSAHVDRSLTILPLRESDRIVLYDVLPRGSGGGGKTGKRKCPLPLSFCIGDREDILAISETTLENYLAGVLRAAMHPDSPLDARKSQAVASRGWILSHLGIHHSEDPYDVCSHPRCPQYGDMPYTDAPWEEAIDATRGEALFHDQRLCRTPSTRQCGGYTDERYGFTEPYIRVVYDGPAGSKSAGSLNREKQLARWMASYPDVYCRPDRNEEGILDPADHAFRWEAVYGRRDLEEMIKKNTGEDIGFLVDILTVKRTVSGRVEEIEILGSRKNLRLRRSASIRNALSEPDLRSTCFLVEKEMGGDGLPSRFTFLGAGYGHGVGLCQMGARRMASQGRRYDEILNHYFKDVELRKIY